MKNIPLFTGKHGMASLVFRELSFSGCAYVLVRAVWNGQVEAFLAECRDFCRAVGAKETFVCREDGELPGEPAYEVLRLCREKAGLPLPEQAVKLEALCPKNGNTYLDIYNSCFREVSGAASYDRQDLNRLCGQDCAFLAKVDGNYAGVAEISKTGLESIAVLPEYRGLGRDLSLTVLPFVPNTRLTLKVASDNERARTLYDRLGFAVEETEKRWYRL